MDSLFRTLTVYRITIRLWSGENLPWLICLRATTWLVPIGNCLGRPYQRTIWIDCRPSVAARQNLPCPRYWSLYFPFSMSRRENDGSPLSERSLRCFRQGVTVAATFLSDTRPATVSWRQRLVASWLVALGNQLFAIGAKIDLR